jgi:hypothetical protein
MTREKYFPFERKNKHFFYIPVTSSLDLSHYATVASVESIDWHEISKILSHEIKVPCLEAT